MRGWVEGWQNMEPEVEQIHSQTVKIVDRD